MKCTKWGQEKVKILIKTLKEIFKIMYKSHTAKLRKIPFSISIYSGNEKRQAPEKGLKKYDVQIII